MAADEKQAQNIVTIMRIVEALRQRGFGILQVGDCLLGRQRFLLSPAPRRVDGDVSPDHDEPSLGVARWTVLRPRAERFEARVLHGFFRNIEITKIAKQRSEEHTSE